MPALLFIALVVLPAVALAQSTTGIENVGCSRAVVARMDETNQTPNIRARIVTVACSTPDTLMRVRLVAADGRRMAWTPDQGTNDLAWMLTYGRERR